MKRYKKPQGQPGKTLLIIMIGAFLMIGAHYLLYPQKDKSKSPLNAEQSLVENVLKESISRSTPLVVIETENIPEVTADTADGYFSQPLEEEGAAVEKIDHKKEENVETIISKPKVEPAKQESCTENCGKIVIIIDDVGMDRKRSAQVIDFKEPLTLAILPYAQGVEEMAKAAINNKHQLLIHVPMEAMNADMDLGSLALRSNMEQEAFDAELDKIFDSFKGYVGINNHMGSRLTQDKTAMERVMKALRTRGLFFVDSLTIHTSVAAQTAKEEGLRYATRDVFLDHEETLSFVRAALKKTENIARRDGFAIAIGHPKDVTIQGLKEWLPTLESKGFELVPVSRVVHN